MGWGRDVFPFDQVDQLGDGVVDTLLESGIFFARVLGEGLTWGY
jgi:hypothetical protein